jgi:uroporphyrinogen decarboxylase
MASDYAITDQVIGKKTLYRGKWRELLALWDGRRDDIARDYGEDVCDLALALEWDYFGVQPSPIKRKTYPKPEFLGTYEWKDGAGRIWKFSPESEGHPLVVKYPTPDFEAIYNLPLMDDSQFESFERAVKRLGKTHFIVARLPEATFPWESTVGMEEYLVMMLQEPEVIEKILAAYGRRAVDAIRKLGQIGVDAVSDGDDYCDNRGPISGDELFVRFTLPALKRIVQAAHDNKMYFVKHSDGNQYSILPHFIEAGVDAWQGIQTRIGMDFKVLKEKFGDRISFFGGANCETMITDTVEDIEKEVRYAISTAGKGGGLAISSSNTLMVGSKLENVKAIYHAAKRFGKYPL